jgi:hypothetical protein
VFYGVRLALWGLAPAWLGCFGLLGLAVSRKMPWFIVVIVVPFGLFLERPGGFAGLPILLSYGTCHPIYLVRMALLFFRCRDMFLFWRDALSFLRFAPEIVI